MNSQNTPPVTIRNIRNLYHTIHEVGKEMTTFHKSELLVPFTITVD